MSRPFTAVRPLLLAAALGCSPAAALAGEPEGRAEATLTMEVRRLDFEGNKKAALMYMPSGVKLQAEKPAVITKEPKYRGAPKYGVLKIGNGERTTFALATDAPEGQDAKVYFDLNGNGDLTDDGDGKWPEKIERDGSSVSYQGTFAFKTTWKGGSSGEYALNFYYSPDRDSINYYRASARTGKISIAGKSYEVMLFENDGDGLFNKLYDPSKPTEPEKLPKPVTLMLDGDMYDIRGTFGFGDYNYVAHVNDDGSKLVLEPTMKVIKLPRPTERPKALGAGGPVPDFEAVLWKPDAAPDAPPTTFKISDFKGKKIVVLDIWATWCGPCMRGIPHISKIAEEVKGQDVAVIALNVWDDVAAFERFAREKGPTYAFTLARDPAARQSDASIASRIFKLSGIPATYVIDKSGKIVTMISGYQEGDKQVEHALVRLGMKIEGITPEEAAKADSDKPEGKTVPMTGLK